MDNKQKIVLLVVPEFPPNNSIGGRRWAKFAKYLAKKNYIIKVIAFKPKPENKQQGNWLVDISHPNIQVYYLPSGYPEILQSSSKNILVRIIKKVCTKIISLYDGGIIQDKAIFFKKRMLSKASELIREFSIKNVICSGPYHRASYFTTLLKKDLKDLNIIIDFRDRWTDGQVYGIEKISDSAFAKESALQKYTCEKANYVISTYQEILNELKQEYKELPAEKFIHFSHNYDPDDYSGIPVKKEENSAGKKIKFIYGGTINTAAFNDGFKPFLYALKKIKEENQNIYQLLNISIFGDHFQLNELIETLGLGDIITISTKIKEQVFYQKVSESDFLLVFLGDKWKDLVTTKNITYLPFRKPIIVVSKKGEVSKMMVHNKIGYGIEPQDCYDNLVNLVQNYLNNSLDFDPHFDYSAFSYEKATEKLIELFKD